MAISAEPLKISFRPPGQDDWNYILDSWKKSFRTAVGFHTPSYYAEISDRIEHITDTPGTVYVLAVDPDDPDFILGWLCHTNNVVHYLFVRQCFRRAHVATRLLTNHIDTDKPITCTSWTRVCEPANKRSGGVLRYEPTRLEPKRKKWKSKSKAS